MRRSRAKWRRPAPDGPEPERKPIYNWESLEEYRDTQKFARHLGRVLGSLPRRTRWFLRWPLTQATVALSQAITGMNLDGMANDEEWGEARERFRSIGLRAITLLRQELRKLEAADLGSGWDRGMALGLLERVERKLTPA